MLPNIANKLLGRIFGPDNHLIQAKEHNYREISEQLSFPRCTPCTAHQRETTLQHAKVFPVSIPAFSVGMNNREKNHSRKYSKNEAVEYLSQ